MQCSQVAIETDPFPQGAFIELKKLLLRGEGEDWNTRLFAVWVLGRATLTPTQKEEAAIILGNVALRVLETRRERVQIGLSNALPRSFKICLALCSAGSLWFLITNYGMKGTLKEFLFSWNLIYALVLGATATFILALALPFLILPFVLPLSIARDRRYNHIVQKEALLSLAQIDMPQCCLPVAQIAAGNSGGNIRLALDTLHSLLHHLPNLPAPVLSSPLAPALSRLLQRIVGTQKEAEIPLILQELERFGDSRALPGVRAVARRALNPDLRQIAHNLIPLLEQRNREVQNAGELLRGTYDPHSAAESLLRPLISNPSTEPERLLRPATLEIKGE